jgi:hypothetical protein
LNGSPVYLDLTFVHQRLRNFGDICDEVFLSVRNLCYKRWKGRKRPRSRQGSQAMKYGILFGIVAVLLTVMAFMHRGWYWLYLWPAVSFGIISAGYLHLGPTVYGKSQQGMHCRWRQLLLWPYLIYLWTVWHSVRLFKRETAFDQLSERIYIGRRLMGRELPPFINHVVDLTCEFSEPKQLRGVDYRSFPILDGFVPSGALLNEWVSEVASLEGNIYIHCAEGHGRTGLFAAALLLKLGHAASAQEAIAFIQTKRPLVRLGSRQMRTLSEVG